MKTVAIIQARMGSSRLPGKILMPLLGKPMLVQVVDRVRRASRIDRVIVATTVETKDNPVFELCEQHSIDCFRGSEQDVLDRYYQAAKSVAADVVVRITADCPLIDPEVIDDVVLSLHLGEMCDYASNVIPQRSYPRGLDVEVFPFNILQTAWREAADPAHREHVTPYIWSQPNVFRQTMMQNNEDWSDHRWTVDTVEDYAVIRSIYEYFGHTNFTMNEVIIAVADHPAWEEINAHIKQKELLTQSTPPKLNGKIPASLSLRAVVEEDAKLLFEWANDPVTRSVSFSSAPIGWEEHLQWMKRKLHDSNYKLWIATDVSENPIGLVRFECEPERAIISVSVALTARGKGIGSKLIQLGSNQLLELRPEILYVTAYIQPSNLASIKAFLLAGFLPDGEEIVNESTALRFQYRRVTQ